MEYTRARGRMTRPAFCARSIDFYVLRSTGKLTFYDHQWYFVPLNARWGLLHSKVTQRSDGVISCSLIEILLVVFPYHEKSFLT